MKRIRVMRVITRLNIGGPAIHVSLLASRLDPTRYETLLVSGVESGDEGNMLELGRLPPIDPRILPTLGRAISPLDDLRALTGLALLARSFKPDIVHTHLAKAGALGRIAARIAGVRTVVHTYHGSVFRGYFGQRESAVYLGIERALARITTRIVAITSGQKADLVDLGIAPSSKIVEIPLGLDLDHFRELPAREDALSALGLPREGRYVAIVARLVPIKDIPTFLRAFALVTESLPDVRGLVIGDGPERGAVERLAQNLGLERRCRFLGWRADLPNVYAASDVVALTSLNEGSPVSVIEAMASGRAVVATAVGGVPDVVSEATGILVPVGDHRGFADAIVSLLRDPDRRAELGRKGREVAVRRFASDRLVADIDRLYIDLLGRRTG
ncbi:MAG: glycosyltransferase family 4 protein [Chloroflexi bacterium]|nr:MAG: glycosyltransferase family 4 protein [Chloroflexota bacterium]